MTPTSPRVWKQLTNGAAALAAAVSALAAPAAAQDYRVNVIGQLPDAEISPVKLVQRDEVQALIAAMEPGPISAEQADEILAGGSTTVGDLLDAKILRDDGRLHLNIVVVDEADLEVLFDLGERYGRSLADAVLSRADEFDAILDRYDVASVSRARLRHLVIGCIVLDWNGLELSEEMSLRSRGGGGRDYVIVAERAGLKKARKGLYWGSHTVFNGSDGFALTSFGDHHSLPRDAFPDLYFRQDGVFDASVFKARAPVADALQRYGDKLFERSNAETIKVMTRLRQGPATQQEIADATNLRENQAGRLIELLKALDYVTAGDDGTIVAASPILTLDDAAWIDEATALGREIIAHWAEVNYDALKQDAGDLTSLRHGVPYERAFSSIWHYVFGTANRDLAEAGWFEDPYAEGRIHKGYLVMVLRPEFFTD